MQIEQCSFEQYTVLKVLGNKKNMYSVWEPADQESQYNKIQNFNGNIYGLVGTRFTTIEDKEEAQKFALEQLDRAKEIISKSYKVDISKLDMATNGFFVA